MNRMQATGSAMGMNREALVRFSQVKKSYDGISYVVKDLNLDVAKGEFLTMLGPSGSGKSTLLDAYIALMMPDTTPFNGASNEPGVTARAT